MMIAKHNARRLLLGTWAIVFIGLVGWWARARVPASGLTDSSTLASPVGAATGSDLTADGASGRALQGSDLDLGTGDSARALQGLQ